MADNFIKLPNPQAIGNTLPLHVRNIVPANRAALEEAPEIGGSPLTKSVPDLTYVVARIFASDGDVVIESGPVGDCPDPGLGSLRILQGTTEHVECHTGGQLKAFGVGAAVDVSIVWRGQ